MKKLKDVLSNMNLTFKDYYKNKEGKNINARYMPKEGEVYFIPDLEQDWGHMRRIWGEDPTRDLTNYGRNMVCKTSRDAFIMREIFKEVATKIKMGEAE